MSEAAGRWFRVSTGGQDEANQIPDVDRHCASHDYEVTRTYTVHGKSASKGHHQTDLDAMLADMRAGVIKVLVIWHSSRIERRPGKALLDLLAEVSQAGGRVESVQEPMLGQLDMGSQMGTFMAGLMNAEKSRVISEGVLASHERIRKNGALIGYAPWGYIIDGEKYAKTLVPTEVCRTYAPQIFARKIAGQSLRTICEWLDAEGVPPVRGTRWNEGSLCQIIRNMTYAGRRQDEGPANADGKPTRKHKHTVMRCEAVVSMDTWKQANAALHTAARRGPGVHRALPDRPLLASLRCARCADSPMYRIRSADGKFYYRCAGRAPQRKGCGNMVPLEATETIVAVEVFLTSEERYRTRQWVAGINWDSEIEDVKQSLVELAQEMPADYAERHAALMTDLAGFQRKNEHEATDGDWDYTDMKMTVGEYFDKLDAAGQREYLKTRDIRVEKATPADPGATRGVRVVIDGEDHGVFPIAQHSSSGSQLAG